MHDILCFHCTHGSAIAFSDDKGVASRTSDYANAVVFSAQPIKVGQKVCVELTQSTEWMGAIRIGVTSHDPAKIPPSSLPRYVSPDLTRKDGYWAKGLDESYTNTGSRVTLSLTSAGQIVYYVNKHYCGVLLTRLPTNVQLWLVFDLYGNTTAVKFVRADELPVEIVARGSDALQAYEAACQLGTQAMFRTRLMFVGQQGVGKTTLKNALLGQRQQEVEESPGTIDLSASCSFSLRDRTSWKLAVKGERSHIFNEDQDQVETSGGVVNIEDDYHQAVAANLVQELLCQKKRHRGHEEREPISGKSTTTRASSGRQRRSSTGRDKRTREAATHEDLSGSVRSHLPQDTPERVVRLVEEMMRQRELGASRSATPGVKDRKTSSLPSHNVQLNIWDFAGRSLYYITHQMFLTARAVYVIVFDLTQDLDTARPTSREAGEKGISSGLDYIDYWLNTIHVHTARNTHSDATNTCLSPPVFIVGTHGHGLHPDSNICQQMVKAKFERVQQMTKNKPYERHIVSHYYAVECGQEEGDDPEVANLRRHLEDIASQEPYMGEQIPLRWLRFESAMAELVDVGTDFVTLSQLQAVAMAEGIKEEAEFQILLQFYHDLGVIVYYGGAEHCDPILRSTVILRPEWLVVMFAYVLFALPDPSKQSDEDHMLWQRLESTGAMEERLVELVWQDVTQQKAALLRLMEKFDLICEHVSSKHATPRSEGKRSFYVPSRLTNRSTSVKLFMPTETDIVFYLDFNGFLPDGLFQRLLTRVVRWSLERGGHEPLLTYHQARCFLDSEHDLALQMAPLHMARIKVTILRAASLDSSDDTSSESSLEKQLPPPKPAAAAKVRHFLEVTLTDLRNKWIQHLSYKTCVQCHCGWPCETHNAAQCSHDQCIHFLNLNECIANKIVCCEHRRVKTLRYRKWFPVPVPLFKKGPILDAAVLRGVEATQGNIESRHGPHLPGWVKSIAKLLNGGSEGQDWTALAYNLGYTKVKLEKFNEDLNPSLAMVTDWIITSGNTPLSVDMMISSLELMQRDDIVEVIQRGRESEVEPVQVFISYQWDIQDEVRALRNKLETAGFTCWMDVGQLGGGDQLYSKIDTAIRGCKVAIACITPKYIVSQLCMKEVGLADLLRKPIIPIMYSKVPWPPLGGMALTFSQLVYININGIGGHGGSGIHADLADKYQEIIQRVSCYAATLPLDVPDPSPHHVNNSDPSMRSASLHSASSQPEAILIEGYASDNSAPQRSMLQRSPPSSGHSQEVPVEQVHITKCTICTIL